MLGIDKKIYLYIYSMTRLTTAVSPKTHECTGLVSKVYKNLDDEKNRAIKKLKQLSVKFNYIS